jgi:tetratricopeptide (TPR) repeat protein
MEVKGISDGENVTLNRGVVLFVTEVVTLFLHLKYRLMKAYNHHTHQRSLVLLGIKSGFLLSFLLLLSSCYSNTKSMKRFEAQQLEETLKENEEINEESLADLEWYGVNDSSELNVQFFFFANNKATAEKLALTLRSLNYTITPIVLENGTWSVNGWTTRLNMSLNSLNQWSEKMCRLAYKSGAEFDYWDVDTDQEPDIMVPVDLDASEYFDLAYDYSQKGYLKKALVCYSKSIELDATDPATWYNRGIIKSRLGNRFGAIDDYSEAIDLDSTYQSAYVNRGSEYDYTESYEEAIDDFNRALKLDSKDALCYYNRGNTWHN